MMNDSAPASLAHLSLFSAEYGAQIRRLADQSATWDQYKALYRAAFGRDVPEPRA